MLSNRVRLKLNKEQQSLCWGYAKVSRRYLVMFDSLFPLSTQGKELEW